MTFFYKLLLRLALYLMPSLFEENGVDYRAKVIPAYGQEITCLLGKTYFHVWWTIGNIKYAFSVMDKKVDGDKVVFKISTFSGDDDLFPMEEREMKLTEEEKKDLEFLAKSIRTHFVFKF